MILEHLADTPLDNSDEAVQMAVTLAAAYFERGDTARPFASAARPGQGREARFARGAGLGLLERQHHGGRPRFGQRRRPAGRARTALLAEGQDGRNLGRLRTKLGIMQLQLDPPQIAEAKQNLEQAAEELQWCSAGAWTSGAMSWLRLGPTTSVAISTPLRDDDARARDLRTLAPLTAADAKSLEGQVHAARGDVAGAAAAYREAVMILTGVGSDRAAAEMWFELAGLLEEVNEFDAARDAYRSAAAASGIQSRPRIRAEPQTWCRTSLIEVSSFSSRCWRRHASRSSAHCPGQQPQRWRPCWRRLPRRLPRWRACSDEPCQFSLSQVAG